MRRDVFQAIADPTRRQIIGMLASNTLNLNEVADQFEISRPAISKHIKILEECGLLTIKQQGRERYCHAKVEKLDEVEEWLAPFRKLWGQHLDRLDTVLKQMKSNSKNENYDD